MTTYVTCSVCGEEVGKMGIGNHAGMHRRQFHEVFGRPPKGYQEVREKLPKHLAGREPAEGQTTLEETI